MHFETGKKYWRHLAQFQLRMWEYLGVSHSYVYLFGGPYKKDYSLWGSILGSPYSRKLPFHRDLP